MSPTSSRPSPKNSEAPWNVVTVQAATAMLASRVLTDCGLTVLDIVTLPDPATPDTPTAEVTLHD